MKCQVCDHENVDEARFCASCGAAIPTNSPPEKDPLVGQIIGNRYRITGVIGEGGMGVVYVGEQQMGSTVRKVAVKTLHQHLSKDENVLKRFHRECGTVAQLEHPNTIKVYDFGSTPDGTLYIAMEFVAGRSLSDAIEKEHRLPAVRVVQIMRQVCGALDEAHELGIIHRDLKPDNIILTQRAGEHDFVKVLDFGIAARTESADAAREQKLTQQGTVLGTPPYMSPEQFTGKALDRRSDVYSLGIMAYELLTGKLPFEAENPWQWATQHMTATPMPFDAAAPNVPIAASMKEAILRALSKDREQRQVSASQFINELARGMTGSSNAVEVVPATNAAPYQPTAAMPEVHNFAAAPAGVPARMATVASDAVGSVAANSATPYIAGPPPKSRGGKSGLLIGLVGASVAVAAVAVVLAVRSNKPSDEPSIAPGASASAAPSMAAATLAPEIPTGVNTSTPEIAPADPVKPHEVAAHKASGKATPASASAAAAAASATPATQTTGTPAATSSAQTGNATQPTTPGANPACASCLSAAAAGDFNSASNQYRSCTDVALRNKCANMVRASVLATARANRNDCAKLRSILAAASSMNAAPPALAKAANDCN
jgi:serine/threonine-protein kinase